MAKYPVCVHAISTIAEIKVALKTSHHSFPVLNKSGKFVGMMPRNFMIVLAKNLAFYTEDLS
jgi:CBS domain-containing protein